MRSTLIAVAAAGLLASGGATASASDHSGQPRRRFRGHRPRAVFGECQCGSVRLSLGDRAANINEREARIRARIERGRSDGRITNFEARRLYRELGAIEAKERSYKADGRLSYREDAELNRISTDWPRTSARSLRDDERTYSYYAR
jgi:hypothetical protein